MAAIAAVFDQLHAGATVVLPDDCYQGVAGLVTAGADRGRWSMQRVALHDTAGWIDACQKARAGGPGAKFEKCTGAKPDLQNRLSLF